MGWTVLHTSIRRIKPKYLVMWLVDQLRQTGWFSRLFIKRDAWFAFLIDSHFDKIDGNEKASFSLRKQAQKKADKLSVAVGTPYFVYKCLYCDGWHVGKASSAGDTISRIHDNATTEMDTQRILATGIPDLAQVYSGFRGRTLSSSKQMYAWKELVGAGINKVIDLRADYGSVFYRELCEISGITFFHFPIAYDIETIDRIIEDFPQFCAMIDDGRFFISCAQGLHRTDIALCLFWVFHGADKGYTPPSLRGYRLDKGMKTTNIMRVLDSVYSRSTEKNGEPPLPESVFNQRKGVINEANRCVL